MELNKTTNRSEALKAAQKKYYEANKAKILAQKRVYYESYKEKMIENVINFRKRNPEKKSEYAKRYYDQHRSEILEKKAHTYAQKAQ